uniref:Uncharacterized protein n=1 Tax=Nelumbo nucifera TaxID=4432 RepID=A0A822YEL2_NELNU|nr:TPA_asm: hypothetical protein HUJ06_031399 [Nelumbo nucifera]
MAMSRARGTTTTMFLTCLFILMALLSPLIQASRSSFNGERIWAGKRTTLVSKVPNAHLFTGYQRRDSGIILDSERQVPTGPDPLHHNQHPLGP